MTVNTTDSPAPPAEASPVFSPDEQRLLLVGLCDFEGRWDILEAAANMVVDGAAKAALIRERLLPRAGQLAALVSEDVAPHQLWIARHWFDTQFCQAEPTDAQPKKRTRAGWKAAQGTRRARQGDK